VTNAATVALSIEGRPDGDFALPGGLPFEATRFGVALGLCVGYAAKKVGRVLMFLAGSIAILGIALQTMDWIVIDWTAVQTTVQPLLVDPRGVTLGERLWTATISSVPYGGGFVGGILISFKLG